MSPNENGRLLGGRAAAKIESKAHPDSLPAPQAAQYPADDNTSFDSLFAHILAELRALYGYATSPQEVEHHRRLEAFLDALRLSVVDTVDVPVFMPGFDDQVDDQAEEGDA